MKDWTEKLEITFNPTKIVPLAIDGTNMNSIINRIRELDQIKYSLDNRSIWDYMDHTIRRSIWDSISASLWTRPVAPEWETPLDRIFIPMWKSIWDDRQTPISKYLKSDVHDSMTVSVQNAMYDFVWASVMVNLDSQEYYRLFATNPGEWDMTFEKMMKYYILIHQFSREGLFIHPGIITDQYLIVSWMYPKNITKISIV